MGPAVSATEATKAGAVVTVVLEAESLTKRFGAFTAVDDVCLHVEEGAIHAVIGPNGAGKSTLFKLLTGVHVPTSGQVKLRGREVTGLRPYAVARAGIVQVFQTTSIFTRLSVEESLATAVLAAAGRSASVSARSRRRAQPQVDELLEAIGLTAVRTRVSGALSHGDQRALEIAVALGAAPSVLLLDEPTAGMSPFETERMTELVRRLRHERSLTVLLSEHDMDVIFGLSDRVTVLHHGAVLAEGSPAEIAANDEVVSVYLGGEQT